VHIVGVDGLELIVEPGEPSAAGDAAPSDTPAAPDGPAARDVPAP
jgi:hypothetical protein